MTEKIQSALQLGNSVSLKMMHVRRYRLLFPLGAPAQKDPELSEAQQAQKLSGERQAPELSGAVKDIEKEAIEEGAIVEERNEAIEKAIKEATKEAVGENIEKEVAVEQAIKEASDEAVEDAFEEASKEVFEEAKNEAMKLTQNASALPSTPMTFSASLRWTLKVTLTPAITKTPMPPPTSKIPS